MKRFDVLSASLDIFKPHFLEASAGTGKTFAIEHLVTRMVLDDKRPCLIDQILVVTFTKAATRELKSRIRTSLECAHDILKNNLIEKAPTYLRSYFEKDEKTRFVSILKLEDALLNFEHASINTIHGFCSDMLSEYPLEALFDITEAQTQGISIDDVIKDILLTYLKLDHESIHSSCEIQRLTKHFKYDLQALAHQVEKYIVSTAALPSLPSFDQISCEIFSKLNQIKPLNFCQKKFTEDFYSLALCYNKLLKRDGTFHEEFEKQIHCLSRSFESITHVTDYLNILLMHEDHIFDYIQDEYLKAKQPKSIKFHYPGLIHIVKDTLFGSLKTLRNPHRILLSVVKACQPLIEKVFKEKGLTTPDQFLIQMKEALSKDEFKRAVQGKFKAAIIDEFQDTDPVQWDIFSNLFISNNNLFPLYLVGDPKQSIYHFRNADLPTYLEAKRLFSEENCYYLDTNYRSVPPLIESLNLLFSKEMASHWLSHDESLIYYEVQASLKSQPFDFEDSRASVHFLVHEQEEWQIEEMEAHVFPFIVCEILNLKEKKGLPLKSFGVLTKDRYQGQRLKKYLKQHQLSVITVNAEHIKETRAFSFIKAFLQALHFSSDIRYLKLLLAHPFIGFSDEDLKYQADNELLHSAYQHIRMLRECLIERGFDACWHSLLNMQLSLDGQTFKQHLISHGSTQDVIDCESILELLLSYVQANIRTARDLLLIIKELEDVDHEKEGKVKRKYIQDNDSVTIMTTHASKGLEFDVVFTLGISSRFVQKISKDKRPIRIKTDKGSQYELYDENNQEHLEEIHEQEMEKMRQLYVALTRAKLRVYVPLAIDTSSHIINNSQLSCVELFFQKVVPSLTKDAALSSLRSYAPYFSLTDLNHERFEPRAHEKKQPALLLPPRMFNMRRETLNIMSFSKLQMLAEGKEAVVEERLIASKTEDPSLMLPLGTETGQVIHTILEKILDLGLYQDSYEVQKLIKKEILFTPLGEYFEMIYHMVMKVLSVKLPFEKEPLSLRQLSSLQIMTETSFLSSESEKLWMKGFIDAIIFVQGKYYIVDWKTNYLGEDLSCYDRRNLEKCMKEHHYFLQAAIYANALKSYLKSMGCIDFEEHFGGAIYVFMRGLDIEALSGIYHFYPDVKLFDIKKSKVIC